MNRRLFILGSLLAPAALAPDKRPSPWGAYVALYNKPDSALRRLADIFNSVNDSAVRLAGYQSGRVVDAGEARKVTLGELKAHYAELRRLLPEADKELAAEQAALDAVQ